MSRPAAKEKADAKQVPEGDRKIEISPVGGLHDGVEKLGGEDIHPRRIGHNSADLPVAVLFKGYEFSAVRPEQAHFVLHNVAHGLRDEIRCVGYRHSAGKRPKIAHGGDQKRDQRAGERKEQQHGHLLRCDFSRKRHTGTHPLMPKSICVRRAFQTRRSARRACRIHT